MQKKTHGPIDAKGLTRPELADRAFIAKEQAEKVVQAERITKKGKTRASTPDEDPGLLLIPATPPKPNWESQGGTSITLALGSPRRAPPPPFPEGLPASTAPPRLAGSDTAILGKRARQVTKRYKESREDGVIESIGLS